MEESERRLAGTKMNDTLVARDDPKITHSIGNHIVAKGEYGVVVYLSIIIDIDTRETFNTTAPNGMTHRIFYQAVKRTEIAASFVHPVHNRRLLVLGMIKAHDTVLPSAHPQTATTIHQQRLGGITLTESRIAHHAPSLLIQAQ